MLSHQKLGASLPRAGFFWILGILMGSDVFAGSTISRGPQNCLTNYQVMDVTPILRSLAKDELKPNERPEVSALETKLLSSLRYHSMQIPTQWNTTELQDLAREVQSFLFQQQPDPSLEALRSQWLLLMLAQHQWDIILPALGNRNSITQEQLKNLAMWQEAEARLGAGQLQRASELLDMYRDTLASLHPWILWRKMEINFLLGDSEQSLQYLDLALRSGVLDQSPYSEGIEALDRFLQAFTVKDKATPSLLKILAEANRFQQLSLAASCTLKVSRSTDNRRDALNSLLNIKQPSSLSLMSIGQQVELSLIEPVMIENFLTLLERYVEHAGKVLPSSGAVSIEQQREDVFNFVEVLQKVQRYVLGNSAILGSQLQLNRLDQIFTKASGAIPPALEQVSLLIARAEILERSHHWLEASNIYRELALKARTPALQRKYADKMLQCLGQASTQSAVIATESDTKSRNETQQTYLQACEVYQNLIPDAGPQVSRCDLMQARQALQSGDAGDARQKLWQIVYSFPNSIEGQTAAERLLDIARNDPDELYLTSDNLLKMRSYQTGPWGIKLQEIRRQSAYLRVTKLVSTEDRSEAYFFFSQKEKGSELANKSLLAAVQIDQESGRLSRAMDRLEIWLQDYPDSPDANTKLLDLIRIGEKSLQLQKTREYIRRTEGKNWTTEQADFLSEKACSIDIIENPLEALNTCQKLPDQLSTGPRLRLRLARALAYSGYSNQLNSYAMQSLIPRKDFSIDEKIEILDLLRKADAITPTSKEDAKTSITNYYIEQTDSVGPHSRRILGALAYQSAQKSLKSFLEQPIHATRSDELVSAVQAKKQAFDELEALYNKVLQTKDPHWGSSALCDLALAAESFAEALGRVPDIEGLDRKKITTQMVSQIAAWRAKSKSYASSASKTIEKYGTLHIDNRRILQESRRLREDPIQWNDWTPPAEVDYATY